MVRMSRGMVGDIQISEVLMSRLGLVNVQKKSRHKPEGMTTTAVTQLHEC